MAKSSYYLITADAVVAYKVYFDTELTPEEAQVAFNAGQYEDIIDEELVWAKATEATSLG